MSVKSSTESSNYVGLIQQQTPPPVSEEAGQAQSPQTASSTPEIAGRPDATVTQGAETMGTVIPRPSVTRLPKPSKAESRFTKLLSSAASLAWNVIEKDNVSASLSLPDIGPVEGKLTFDPIVHTLDDKEVRRDPEWNAFVQDQKAKGFDVYFVGVRAKIDMELPVDALIEVTGNMKLIAEPEMSVLVPVLIPTRATRSRDGLSRFFSEAFSKVVHGLPFSLDSAQRLQGPWEATIAARYGIEGSVHRGTERIDANAYHELRTKLRMSADGTKIVGEIERQIVPGGGISTSHLLHNDNDLRLRVGGGQDLTFYRIKRDEFAIDLTQANRADAEKAYSGSFMFRRPSRGTGITRERTEDLTTWADGTKANITVGFKESSITVKASRKEIPRHDIWIRNDQFRSEAIENRDIEYERLAWTHKRSLGISGRTTVGPVTIGGGVRHTVGHYEEMIIEHPRSIMEKIGSHEQLLSVPETAAEIMRHSAGEQFRTLTVEKFKSEVSVGHGVVEKLGPFGASAEIRTGPVLSRTVIRDFKRYVLPDNHVLVDVRDYSMRELSIQIRAEATIELFSRDDIEEVLADYLGGTLAGPLARLVDNYLAEIELYAEHITGLEGRTHERMLRAELDLNLPEHREVFALLQAGELEKAAAMLEQLVLNGGPLNYAAETPLNDGEETVYVQYLPGGGSIEMSHQQGAGSTVREAYSSVSPNNQLIASYVGERIAELGYPQKWAIGIKFADYDFRLFSSEAFREHSSERASYSTAGPNGETHVITMHRDSADLRIERKLLWANDELAYHLVEFKEKKTDGTDDGEWSEPQVYVVADYASDEWISGSNLEDFLGFTHAVGGDIVKQNIKESNWFMTLIGRRHGSGEIRVRTWIPWEGMQTLGQATDDHLYQAAAITATIMDEDPQGELPAWVTNVEARRIFAEWRELENEPGPGDSSRQDAEWQLEREYKRVTGLSLTRDNTSNDRESFDVVANLMKMRDSFRDLKEKSGASETTAADAWRDFGDEHGRDYWTLGIVRWVNLLQRDPQALQRRQGDDDLFFLDIAELDSKADVVVAQEKPLPDDVRRMEWARKRAHQGYKIVSL